jgi:hypothetical protein
LKSADILGGCVNNKIIPYCAIPIPLDTFKPETTSLLNGKWGCQSTEPGNQTVSSLSHDEDRVKSYCYYNDNCVGYYSDYGKDTFIATDAVPSSCADTDFNKSAYPYFNRKLKKRTILVLFFIIKFLILF